MDTLSRTEIEKWYVDLVRSNISTLSNEVLDQYRRHGEQYGSQILIGDLSGDELSEICDVEIAGRFIALPFGGR